MGQTFCRCVPPWSRGRQPWCHRTARSGEEKYVIFHKNIYGKLWHFSYFERQLVLLSSPYLESLVVPAQLPEELGADGEEAAGHHGAAERPKRKKKVPFYRFLPF